MSPLIDRFELRMLALVGGLLLAFHWPLPFALHLAKLPLTALLLTYGLMPATIRLAHHFGALDIPDARRVHAVVTPRIGGVAVLASVNLTLLLNFDFSYQLKGVILSSLLVAAISLWDDIRSVPASIKLLLQGAALAVLIHYDVRVDIAPDLWWGDLAECAITAVWIVGITNAFNFLDGINGLAASLAAIVCLLLALLALSTHQPYMALLTLVLVGGALGFLPDNARYGMPAATFLGDVGSTYLGWMMASVAVMAEWSSAGILHAYSAPIMIFSVMIFDMIHTTVDRILRGDVKNFHDWIAYVGRDHLHHRLMALGFSQRQSVLVVVMLALLTGLAALALVGSSPLGVWLLLLQMVVIYGVLAFVMRRGMQRA